MCDLCLHPSSCSSPWALHRFLLLFFSVCSLRVPCVDVRGAVLHRSLAVSSCSYGTPPLPLVLHFPTLLVHLDLRFSLYVFLRACVSCSLVVFLFVLFLFSASLPSASLVLPSCALPASSVWSNQIHDTGASPADCSASSPLHLLFFCSSFVRSVPIALPVSPQTREKRKREETRRAEQTQRRGKVETTHDTFLLLSLSPSSSFFFSFVR